MSYDLEREKQKSEEIRKAFREMFPLAYEHDLPWAACQIKAFLLKKIEEEVADRVIHFQRRIASILCEVSPPKTHMEDMARIVVDDAKKWRNGQETIREARLAKGNLEHALVCLRRIGRVIGCNHVEDQDGREKLVQCVEDVFRAAKEGDSHA